MEDLKDITREVCTIARQAGQYIKEQLESFSLDRVEQKNNHDYVSYVDKHSEEMIVNALKQLPIEAGFITEEKTAQYNNEAYCWVIDPLDGTTNFIHHYAPFAVSIALRKEREILIGVVYIVPSDECFYAWEEGGAFLNGKAISVNKQDDIDKALLCIELPYNDKAYHDIGMHLLNHFYGRAGGIRMNGSAASALCYVAAGRLDGWLEKYIGQWDYSAGVLIITEAGGKVTDFSGSDDYLFGDNIVATNGVIHKELLKEVKAKV